MKKTLLAIAAAGVLAFGAPRPAAAHSSVFFGFSLPGFSFVAAPPPPPVFYAPAPYAYYRPAPVYVRSYYSRGFHDHGNHRGWWKHHRDRD